MNSSSTSSSSSPSLDISIPWYSLLTKSSSFDSILTFLQTYNIDLSKFEEKHFTTKNENHDYYFDYTKGISLGFNNKTLNSIFLYGKYDKKFKNWFQSLPYNLNFDMNNTDIVSFLGEPNTKSGGKTIPISIAYHRLGLEITFIGTSWEILDNKISFICLYEPKKNPELMICGVCAKNTTMMCGNCQLVSYCSTECQRKHWKVHKSFCYRYKSMKKEE